MEDFRNAMIRVLRPRRKVDHFTGYPTAVQWRPKNMTERSNRSDS